jgi:DNA-binding SARP family transcriptional activator/predicted ATPase
MSKEKSRGKLELNLLGSPEVWLDGQAVQGFRSAKARALLYYLAATGRAQPRSVLAGLFWGSVAENHARRSLTMTLSNLRQLMGHYLDISREAVALDPGSPYWLDVAVFEAGVQGHTIDGLKQAIDLYRGDFLEGFYLHDAPEFEQWMLIERTRLREQVLQALHRLADHLAAQHDLPQASETIRRLLALEPWREEAHLDLMLLLARNGQRSAALAQYETCRQLLAEELGVEPGSETTAIYEQIRDGTLSWAEGKQASEKVAEQESKVGQISSTLDRSAMAGLQLGHNLPSQPTPFVGREQELAHIIRRLTDKDCRLLTLIGPGGIGKTRLAMQVAHTFIRSNLAEDFFEHGIYFVPLATVNSIAGLVLVIAEATNLSFYGDVSPKQQLLDHLRKKQMLLVLDNLEHLLSSVHSSAEGKDASETESSGAIGLIADILTAAPQVKILVTSREALNLQEAWFHPVEGMSFPAGERQASIAHESEMGSNAAVLERYDAIQLFVQCAARVRVDFSLAAERAAVVRICQLVEGMPLAIELAAAWLKVLPVEAIAAEIERGLDILTTRHQNIPERHRSMRVVLEQSWQLLTAREREVFKRLSVFRGGFTHAAANAVAEASLVDLATFVDKSLLQVAPTRRYHIHELLRQYAAEWLAEYPEDVAKIYERHCSHYMDFLHQRFRSFMGGQQRQAIAAIAAEYDNVWAAWRWALKTLKLTELQKSANSLQAFYQFQSRYQEGASAWEEAYRRLTSVEATEPIKLTLVHVIVWWGWMLIRLGRLDKAELVLKQCCDLYRELGIPALPGYGTNPRLHLSLIATIQGDYANALQYGERALRESETQQHTINLYQAYYVLASAALGQGQYETARQYAQQAYSLAQQNDDGWFTAYCLNMLGNSELALGHVAVAHQHFAASYTLREAFNDPEGMAVALNHLGEIALRQENYDQARQLYQKSLNIYRDISDKGGLVRTHKGLGTVASRQGDIQTAQQHLYQALQRAAAMQFVPLVFSILNVIGELLLKSGRPEQGLRIWVFVRQHPASDHAAKTEAEQYLDIYGSEVGKEQPDFLAAAQAYAENRTWQDVVAEVLQEVGGGLW